MNLSENMYFNFFTIGALIPTIFMGVVAYFFIVIKNKTQTAFHLAVAYTCTFGFYFAYIVSAAVYHPLAAYHRWIIVTTALIQIFHVSLAFFSFPDVRFPRFRKIYIAAAYLIFSILIAFFFYESYYAEKVFLFASHNWDFVAEKPAKLISTTVILLLFFILILGIWRAFINRGIERWAILSMTIVMFISLLIPGIANLLSRDGLLDRGIYQLAQNLSSLTGIFVITIIFLNTTKDRSTFMTKILLTTTATILLMGQGFTYYSLQEQEKSFDLLLQSETHLSIKTDTFPADMEYIVAYTPKDGIASSKFKNDKKREALNLSEGNQEFYNTLIYEKIRNIEKTGFKDKLKTLLSDATPLFAGYKTGILEFASLMDSNENDPSGKVLNYIDSIERHVLYTSNKVKQLPDKDFALHLKKFLPTAKSKIFNGAILEHLAKSVSANANLKKEVLAYLTPMKKPGARIYRKDAGDKNHYVAIMEADAVGNKVFEAGYPYLNYRNYVHETSQKYIILILIMVGVILAGFPLFFRGSLIKPIKNLLEGLKEMQQGNLKVQIPIRVEDEFGYMSRNFNTMATELNVMKNNLEDIVTERTKQLRQKTNDIQSMLQNMPQGVLTIMDNNIIHQEYSAYLETIFETKDIAGKNLMALVFTDTNLGSDILSQVEVAAGACIGEDKMNFEFNTHLMVTEFDKKMVDGRVKSLELSWSPICGEKETIEKIMLCVRDVTELKQLAAEATKQKRELEIIGEILSVNQEKFHEFIDNSRQFVSHNEGIIKKAGDKNLETVSLLFRNMHTIKGNSRTYGLLHLTNMIHETEQGYDELRKNPDAQWKPDTLLAKLSEASAMIEEYAKINDVKLGRKGPGRRGRVEKFLLVEKVQIAQSLQMLDAVDRSDINALRNAVKEVGNTLKLIGTEKISEVLAGILDSMPSLAKELGKEAPIISIEDHGIAIRSQGGGLIKNVFMHVFRNAIDHGLEKASARVAQGKTPVGNIRLEVSIDKGQLLFKMHDDGRGLPLYMIRQRAIENKLMAEGEARSAEELAQFILLPGFSTAEVVTEVSGRGVGMDAVKVFLKDEGGKLEIRFLDANVTADFRPFEVVISLPEKFALKFDG